MAYRILSLDLGASCGWALIKDSVVVASGTRKFPKTQVDGENLYKFCNSFLNQFIGIDEVFYERVDFVKHRSHAKSFFNFEGALLQFIYATKVRSSCLTPSEWKKLLTGKSYDGKMKNEKLRLCNFLHGMGWQGGRPGTDEGDDEADALGLAAALLKKRGQELKFSVDLSF